MRLRSTKVLGWRRIATAIWRGPSDPQIYGMIELDATPALKLIARARARGAHVTMTHVVGRAIAHALAVVPELNVRLRLGRHLPRPSVDVFFITAIASGHDLSGVKVTSADRKSVVEVAAEVAERAHSLKGGRDPGFNRSKRFMERLPMLFLRPLLRAIAYVTGAWGRRVKWLGLEASPFGSAMISSVGVFGLQIGYSPLSWLYQVPVLVVLGEVTRKPVAVGEEIELRPMVPVTASIDHRYADGAQIARLTGALKEYLRSPERFEPELPAPVEPTAQEWLPA